MDNILALSRYRTYKEILDEMIMYNPNLESIKYEVYYFLTNSKQLLKPEKEQLLGKEQNEDFIIILIDIHSDNDMSFYQLLQDKEQSNNTEQNQKENEEEIESKKKKEETKDKEKEKEKNEGKDKENEKKKEKEKLSKEEKEKIEKEKKEREKELKRRKKEEEKRIAQLKKEMKEKEKEENKKRKQLEKEREKEKEKKREREKYIAPPYGINNYGNTCYFNSVNQIFFNLPILQQIFLDPRIDYFINKTNKFGHQGKFFEKYKSLYWIKPSKVGDTVQSLKSLVGKLKEDFNNNDQQDANEYLNFVIENLHEELNLYSTKRYIEEKDDIHHHNTVEELGNISWANNLRRNASFIDSIFMFQLKSNLKCRKCKTKKVNFETNYIFDLPLSLCKMVNVEIYLYRLPFRYKLYYNKINEKFDKYKNEEKNKKLSLVQNLWNYYSNVLTIEEKKEHCVQLHFSFDLERDKKMSDITKILRGIKPLELEPENAIETINNEKLIEYKIENYTDLITYSNEKNRIIYPNSSVDKYVNINDNIKLNIYEVLNTNGMRLLFEEDNNNHIKTNLMLYSYIIKKGNILNLDDLRDQLINTNYYIVSNKEKENLINEVKEENNVNIENNQNKKIVKKECNILSLREKMIYFPKEVIKKITTKRKIKTEFAIPIYHYYRSSKDSAYLFRDAFHTKFIQFPIQYVILNNSYNIKAKQLYEYIWYLNTLYMNHPNKNPDNFWWNVNNNNNESDKVIKNDIKDNNENNIIKEEIHNENNVQKEIKLNIEKNIKNNIQTNNFNNNGKEIINNINQKNENEEQKIKKCYPFVLRYTEIPEQREDYQTTLIHCPICPWYSFCPGCIIDPNDNLKKLNSDFGIVVDWCTSFINEEFIVPNFKLLSKDIDNQIISENLPFNDKEENYQSIKDCFDLFFVEENLEDPLYCHKCQGPEDFTKKYVINKMPYVLILSLKRFKFNQNSNFKLRQMITYPLYNLELGGHKYDLYGVINHYGSLNSGHYTCIIKKKDKKENKYKWVMCDDSNVYYLDEKRVMNANAYILFYINKESPYKSDYFRFMKSLMNNVEKKEKEYVLKEDNNYFKGEPVMTKYGEGYVIEDNIDKFDFDENYDIYDDLRQKDCKRIEKIIKKDNEEEEKEKEKNKDKKGDKEINEEDKNKEYKKQDEKKKGIEDKQENKEVKTNNDKNNNEENKANNEIKKEDDKVKKEINKEEKVIESKNIENHIDNNKADNKLNNEGNKNENKKIVYNEESRKENENNIENKEVNKTDKEKNKKKSHQNSMDKMDENVIDNNIIDIKNEESEKVENPNEIIEKEENPNKIIENGDNPNNNMQKEEENPNKIIEKNENPNKLINNDEKSNMIIEREENPNKIIKEINNKEKKELYKNIVRVKFDYGEGWINKMNVKKYSIYKAEKDKEEKQKEKEKKK